jgi:hypothetical protein
VGHSRDAFRLSLVAPPVLAATLALAPPLAFGQSTTGRLTGTVTDASGAVLQGLVVVATHLETNSERTVTTNETGTYTLANLSPGTYIVTAARAGFRTFVADGLPIDSGQVRRVDITMEIGEIQQRIEVSARAAPLGTDTVEVSFAAGSDEASALPLIGRNYLSLTLLSAGVVATNPSTFANGLRTTSGGRPYINGNRKEQNSLLLDGVDNNQTTDNQVAYQPSPDAIQEVRLITNNAPAEFGNYQGGILSVTLKPGTNHLHGTGFAFVRDDALNAANWAVNWRPLDPLNPRRKGPYDYYIFGGSAGGPIARNRASFFADYQGTRRRAEPVASLVPMATPEMRRGDFSALLLGPNPQQLHDPFTTRPDPTNPARWLRDPFPGNQIPIDRINPVASALFASPFYPLPSLPGPVLNHRNGQRTSLDNHQFDVRTDLKLSGRDDVSVRYAQGRQETKATNTLTILMATANTSPFAALALQWTRHFGQVVSEARAGFNRVAVVADTGVDAGDIGALGEAIGIAGANEAGPGLPVIYTGAVSIGGSTKVVQDSVNNTFHYQETLTVAAGTPHAQGRGARAALPAERLLLGQQRPARPVRILGPVHARPRGSAIVGIGDLRLLPRLSDSPRPRRLRRPVGPSQHAVGRLRAGRLARHEDRHSQPRPPLRVPDTVRRGTRSASELRPGHGAPTVRRPGREQPQPGRGIPARLAAAPWRGLEPGALGWRVRAAWRLRGVQLPRGHGHEPAPDAESAVLQRAAAKEAARSVPGTSGSTPRPSCFRRSAPSATLVWVSYGARGWP